MHQNANTVPMADAGSSLEPSVESLELNIDNLPNELLAPIFNNLTSDSLEQARLVCTRWKSIVEEDIGLEVFVSDFGDGKWSRAPQQLGDEVVRICHVRMITGSICGLKKPDKLQKLYFKAPVSASVFQTLTCNATNLTKMYFLHSSLSVHDISTHSLTLPSLKILHLCDRSLESGDSFQPSCIPKNINFMLSQTFNSLTELIVSTVSNRVNTRSFGVNLLQFVQAHYCTLQILKLSVFSTTLGVHLQDQNVLDHYESIRLTPEEKQFNWEKLKKVSFRILELDFGKNFVVGLDEWSRILECQSRLKTINLFKEAPVSERIFKNPIIRSCQSLVSIQLGVQIIDEDLNLIPMDCALFEVCHSLRKLGLCGNGAPDRPLRTELINCANLPKDFLELLLKNIYVESTDLEAMIFRCDNVFKLTLDGVGSKEQFGMTLNILDKVMGTKKCLELIIKTFNNFEADQYPELMNEFEKELVDAASLPNCHFHAKFNDELNQYIFICV